MAWQERKTPEKDGDFLTAFVDLDGDVQRMAEYYMVDHQSIRRRLKRIEKDAMEAKLTEAFHAWAVAEGHLTECDTEDWVVKKWVRK